MQGGAPNYFISVSVYRAGAAIPTLTFVLGAVWAEIDRVPQPSVVYMRPPVPDRIAPTVLPAHIPSRVPPRVIIPSPAEPPEPPAVAIPLPPKPTDPSKPRAVVIRLPPEPAPLPSSLARPINVPRGTFHKALAWVAVGSACLLLAAIFMALMVNGASYAPHNPVRGAVVSVIASLMIFAFIFGAVWLVMEVRHEAVVGQENASRNAALAKWRRKKGAGTMLVRRRLARRKTRRTGFGRNGAVRRRRREEAYRNAIRSAVAEQERASAEKRRVKAQREETHRNAVRLANAQRETVLADMRREKERR